MIITPLGILVRCTESYWSFISEVKHPSLKDKVEDVISTLLSPDEIRKSKKDASIYLFYKGQKPRWVCVVCKDEKEYCFVVTAYPTNAIKSGDLIWKK